MKTLKLLSLVSLIVMLGCASQQCVQSQAAYSNTEAVVIKLQSQIAALPPGDPTAQAIATALKQAQNYAWIAEDSLLLICPSAAATTPVQAVIPATQPTK